MKVGLILGNGFTIDFLNHAKLEHKVDVTNLFKEGSRVRWPADKQPGFLSFKHCPHLWSLGARTTLTNVESISLIEDILTCANIFNEIGPHGTATGPYLNAYMELSLYLRHLFVEYNQRVVQTEIDVENWGWSELFRKTSQDDSVEQVVVATYNYDIWLERVLDKLDVPYSVFLGTTSDVPERKFQLYKPHGSISFCHKNLNSDEAFEISKERRNHDCSLSDLRLGTNRMAGNYSINPMIPPAGDSNRFGSNWAREIRESLLEQLRLFSKGDHIFICGLSYWHVDRRELDEIFRNISHHVNVHLINPAPSSALLSVLTSLFQSFVHHPKSEVLKEIFHD